eukprot:evm.model.scf_1517.3 EVM.evm.TU.scf_1517.3   scf_1517:22087-26679(+)
MARHAALTRTCAAVLANLLLAAFLAPLTMSDDAQGGGAAPLGRFPSVVLVKKGDRNCSGVLKDAWSVLTSANCATEMGLDATVIVSVNGTFGANVQVFSIKSIRVHPDWSGKGKCASDVAVLRLTRRASGIETGIIATGAKCAFPGTTVYAYEPGDALKFALLQVVACNPETCPRLEGGKLGQLCVVVKEGNITTDSIGGPVMTLDIPPGFNGLTDGLPGNDLVVGILSDVYDLPEEGRRAGCMAEISGLISWINPVVKDQDYKSEL